MAKIQFWTGQFWQMNNNIQSCAEFENDLDCNFEYFAILGIKLIKK